MGLRVKVLLSAWVVPDAGLRTAMKLLPLGWVGGLHPVTTAPLRLGGRLIKRPTKSG